MPDITLRPVRPEDDSFVLAVFIASHSEYDSLPLPPDQKKHIVEMQFRLQTADYKTRYPESGHQVILAGGMPVGRVWLATFEHELRIVDIGLLAEARNSGTGSAVVKRFQEEARQSGKPLRATVFRFNEGSLRWHTRLGFVVEQEDELMWYLVWRAS
jgi:hypothetical protein